MSNAEILDPTAYFPHYQPVVDLVTGCIGGYEALARYRDEQGVVRSAGPLFHGVGSDRLRVVDRHIRAQALSHFAEHPEAGYLALNISPDWIDRLEGDASPTIAMIEASGIDPARVVIEITEGQGELSAIQRLVQEYHNAGLRVAIDDFGAGASQIDRVAALRPDILKLDMRLFKQAAVGGVSADAILACAAIAQRVGCDIVCEGVETIEELHFGIECGARYIQGHIYQPALPALLDKRQPLEQTRAIQQSFLDRKTERLRMASRHNRVISQRVADLRLQLIEEDFASIDPSGLAQSGILRYYLCNADGTQVTDNFELSPAGLVCQPEYMGSNWSHRPYFPLLLALGGSATRELVVSNAYRDVSTRQLCKTYATFIGDDLILLVDAEVEDEVLYAPMG
ncbi:EAL domain-containing protein [Marinimicrobium alkaliphilum]|uniref:EAL domain-containing protein n=1 Tax=Marinimicrobium alkaliphilum TaxID=2202654 RepID=UPI000DBA859E|nr:EAL domain-containing protein [Marinimicrobium alkaliphilum]